jgi:uncharacterized protein YdeI (YjbR/CyaY-like superfamily)
MKKVAKPLAVGNRQAWRVWLQENHASEKEIWLTIVKKRAAKPGIGYDEALEEALCFGWIDGLMRSLDDETFTLRFSPRKPRSIWSEGNKQRVERLIEEGRMTGAGLAKIQEAKANGEWDKASEREDTATLPSDLAAALEADDLARSNWSQLAPSQKKQYLYWISSARTQETRQRRIRETVRAAGEKRGAGTR